jgi:hypothetical protein
MASLRRGAARRHKTPVATKAARTPPPEKANARRGRDGRDGRDGGEGDGEESAVGLGLGR